MENDMAIVVVHYNWVGYKSLSRNLHRFLRYIKSKNIPLYGIELSLSDSFETKDIDSIRKIKVSEKNIFFQKEACINSCISYIPEKYNKIAWIDHDIFFSNDDWYDQTSIALNSAKLVQMYNKVSITDEYGKIKEVRQSFMNNLIHRAFISHNNLQVNGSVGYAWAARREMWKHGGLYPYCFLGGGDNMFVHSIFDTPKTDRIRDIVNSKIHEDSHQYINWKTAIKNYILNDVAYINGIIYHEWHGNFEHRKYKTRYSSVPELTLKDIYINSQGILELANNNTYNTELILKYFRDRREDG